METKSCQNCKKNFTIEEEDFSYYKKIKVPPPTWCPECRLVRRLVWRNDRYLSKVVCNLCGDTTLSTFPAAENRIIYCSDCYRSDNWDPLSYGQEYDFSKPFFEQFNQLMQKVPARARFVSSGSLVNSDYTNLVSHLKNCYLIYNADYDENCMYGTEIENSRDCVDNTMIDECEQSYGNINCQKCYKAFFSTDCIESSDVWFSYDLIGCLNCFGCVGLRNKNYFIFNQPYHKDEYHKRIKEIFNGSFKRISEIEIKLREIYLKTPRRYMHGRQNTNVSGDYIYNSKDVKSSYIATEAQNCKYCMWLIVPTTKDCFDYTEYGDKAEQIYESVTAGKGVSKLKFISMVSTNSSDVEYSFSCRNVQDVFGCNALKKKSYCILNKQYSKEEYEILILKIKKHMDEMPYVDKKGRIYKYGEFFPIDMAPFAYNQTNAQEFFPLDKKAIENIGCKYEEIADKDYVPTRNSEDLPDSISEVEESFLEDIFGCGEWGTDKAKMQNCTKAFRITPNELSFYRKHNIPIPRKCPNCRHFDRIKRRNPISFWHRTCMKEGCSNEFETSYSPDRPEIVYCEQHYQQEVY